MSTAQATVHVDLDAIQQNFSYVRELSPASKIMAVIKADGYGHGAAQVARKLRDADAFGVARVSEAVKLREAGVHGPICLLEGVLNTEELNLASIYELQVVIHAEEQLEMLGRAGARRAIWLKIDTGMGRLGLSPDRAEALIAKLGSQQLLGLMTHFACADEPDETMTESQIETIVSLSQTLQKFQPAAGILNLANSAAILAHPHGHADWVRPGLMLYGGSPMVDGHPNYALQPAMTFSAPVIAIRQVKAGTSVGYGATWTAEKDSRIAVVAAGYADGYPREVDAGASVLVHGQMRDLVGRVSMDMLSVRLEDEDSVEIGDQVVLWGEGLPIEEVARHAGTIPYTLMCGIGGRVRRTWRGEVRG